jgi:hypothetical protein
MNVIATLLQLYKEERVDTEEFSAFSESYRRVEVEGGTGAMASRTFI